MPDHGVPHGSGPGQDVRTNVGPFSAAGALRAGGDALRAADLRAGRRGRRGDRGKTRGDAEGARTSPVPGLSFVACFAFRSFSTPSGFGLNTPSRNAEALSTP